MEFKDYVTEVYRKVWDRLGDDYDVEIQHLPKNNGVILTGLGIRKFGEDMALTVKLDQYFKGSTNMMPTDQAADEIIRLYRESEVPEISKGDLLCLDKVRGKIALKLVNTEANRELLKSVPHIDWLGLSVVFYLLMEQSQTGQTTAMIHQGHADVWNVTAEELFQIASENMEKLLPVRIMSMVDLMQEMIEQKLGEAFTETVKEELMDIGEIKPMYVLTNHAGIYGACYMLPGMGIERLAEELGSDLVVIPSSIHEVLAVPYEEGLDLKCLTCMLQEINLEHVPREDRLSDRVYYFDREKGMLMVGDDGEIV